MNQQQSPLFFGSALIDFGVTEFLDYFMSISGTPSARMAKVDGGAEDSTISSSGEQFAGQIFKTQANLDPKHRDRISYVRVISGTYTKGMKVKVSQKTQKTQIDFHAKLTLSRSTPGPRLESSTPWPRPKRYSAKTEQRSKRPSPATSSESTTRARSRSETRYTLSECMTESSSPRFRPFPPRSEWSEGSVK